MTDYIENLYNSIISKINKLILSHNSDDNAHSNNKVTSVSGFSQTPTDTKIPSEKLVKEYTDGLYEDLATVATTGSYNDLDDKPTITEQGTVDGALSSSSENAVQNKVVTQALNEKANTSDLATVATTGSYNDLEDKPTITAQGVVDTSLSSTSTNAVQNKIIKAALDEKADNEHTHTQEDITDFPNVPSKTSDLTNDSGFLTEHQDISGKVNTTDLATVATTGKYSDLSNIPSKFSPSTHSHEMNDINSLSTSLDAKANKVHSHSEYASSSHSHGISEITNLQSSLNGKSDTGHTHSGYASSTHNHDSSYAAKSHSHTEYASSSHNHDLSYSSINHNHDSSYAAKSHSHSEYTTKNDLLSLYPVGSIYMSTQSTNPSTFIGGTWIQLQDRFLLGAGSEAAGTRKGSRNAVVVEHNHTQNAHNHPPHGSEYTGLQYLFSTDNGNIAVGNTARKNTEAGGNTFYVYSTTATNIAEYDRTGDTTATNNAEGVSGVDANMPPYLVVYMWYRAS